MDFYVGHQYIVNVLGYLSSTLRVVCDNRFDAVCDSGEEGGPRSKVEKPGLCKQQKVSVLNHKGTFSKHK